MVRQKLYISSHSGSQNFMSEFANKHLAWIHWIQNILFVLTYLLLEKSAESRAGNIKQRLKPEN